MAQPEVSCHPETLLPGARSVVSAALCYWQPEPPLAAGQGRLAALHVARRLRRAARAARRARPGDSAAPTACSSTRTSTSTARPPRARGVGFYGKNTMLITRRHGSWVVLGTLVTDVELEPTPPLEPDCGTCTALHRRLPDGRARRAGRARRDEVPLVLDAGAAGRSPSEYRARARGAGLRLRHLPGRLPVEPRRREAPRRPRRRTAGARRSRRLARGRRPADRRLRPSLRAAQRPRFLRRNALVALGNIGGPSTSSVLERHARRRARPLGDRADLRARELDGSSA